MTRLRWIAIALTIGLLGFVAGPLVGQPQEKQPEEGAPDLAALVAKPRSEMAIVMRRYEADRGSLQRFYTVASSPTRFLRMKRFTDDWSAALRALDIARFSDVGRADFRKFQEKVASEQEEMGEQIKTLAVIWPLLSFAPAVIALEESRQRMDKVDPPKAAGLLNDVKGHLARLNKAVSSAKVDDKAQGYLLTKPLAAKAADAVAGLRTALKNWFAFYNDYDPTFTWWTANLYKEADQAMQAYAAVLRDKGDGITIPAAALPPGMNTMLRDPSNRRPNFPAKQSDVPNLKDLIAAESSEMAEVLLRYQSDRGGLGKLGGLPGGKGAKSAEGQAKSKKLNAAWLAALEKLNFDKLSRAGQVDYLLLRNSLLRDLRRLELEPVAASKVKDVSGISGSPIGREALLVELAGEMISYSPEELMAIADKEYAWCEAEMKKASNAMGFGDDWLKAVEKVKTLYVPPGQQPAMIRDLAWEAVAYLKQHDMVTVPAIAQETWRMEMMTPARQLVNPFFTGGEVISVSYPTSSMSYEDKLQSMRGNNPHFSAATVHHELIPGHHLQQFMNARYSTQRRPFSTAFWTEGWALYWELVLYERGFAQTPEDKVGFMFWRMHRCARIHFSLGFHLGKMTPQECIDYLVKRVGHEPANAAAEVRRSFQGNYGPLYQAAYLLGGLQLFDLRKHMVGITPDRASDEEFHDAILQAGNMPIEMVRAQLSQVKLKRDHKPSWKFYSK